jgi:hypothetical protein
MCIRGHFAYVPATVATRQAAHEAVKPMKKTLRQSCLDALRDGPATADEIADRIGKAVLSIRPRMSELADAFLICETGQRRRNSSGKMAAVWRLRVEPQSN